MGQVYFGVYRRDTEEGVRALAADALLNPDAVSLPEEGTFLAVGAGWTAYPQLAARLQARVLGVEPLHLPSAGDVARLARPRFLSGRLVSPAGALPNYLRDCVASPS
jgi:tRNA threonylcarbamoyladenosine biosynthesis protein TsaB